MSYSLSGFQGKVAVVTGAGRMRSIGHTIAIELAKAGCNVAVVGSKRGRTSLPDDEKAVGWRDVDSVCDEIVALGRAACAFRTDIADEDDVVALRDAVVDQFGRVDIVVNNASVAIGQDRVPVVDLDHGVWQRLMDVNLTGTFLVSKHFGARLVEQRDGGSIINISSTAGILMAPKVGAYGASKAAVQSLTGSMAQEVAHSGVRVNAVLPGLIDTARMDGLGRGETWQQYVEANIPLGRAGTPHDVAALVVFLCSEEAAWITGQQFVVDGGRAVGR